MIDFGLTLEPRSGLAAAFEVAPPLPLTDLLWRTLVQLNCDAPEVAYPPRADDDGRPARGGLSHRIVGAYGRTRADSLTRGVGEGVERFALFPPAKPPPGAERGTAAELAARRRTLRFQEPDTALGHPQAADLPLLWYPSRRLRDGRSVMVPADTVDYPAATETSRYFDPAPSGAASGPGFDRALRSALFEVIERDAFQVAWSLQLCLPQVAVPRTDPNGVSPGEPGWGRDRGWRDLARLTNLVKEHDLVPVVAQLPVRVRGVVCAAAVILDETAPEPVASVGCKASDDTATSMLGALQEALQLRSVLLNSWFEQGLGAAAPPQVTGDDERLRFLASRPGYASVLDWVAGFTDPQPPPGSAAVSSDELVQGMCADGADPLLVDLTYRLPSRLQEMGWVAVKVIPVGYQQLRMDERHEFTWNISRLDAVASRAALARRRPTTELAGPHPLP